MLRRTDTGLTAAGKRTVVGSDANVRQPTRTAALPGTTTLPGTVDTCHLSEILTHAFGGSALTGTTVTGTAVTGSRLGAAFAQPHRMDHLDDDPTIGGRRHRAVPAEGPRAPAANAARR